MNLSTLTHMIGGGYILPALDSQYLFVEFLRKEVQARYGENVSVAFLEYSQ
jgi:hypothetical protein